MQTRLTGTVIQCPFAALAFKLVLADTLKEKGRIKVEVSVTRPDPPATVRLFEQLQIIWSES